MSFTYKAFISYRHKPLDSSVAVKVQRTVERYTVPKDLRDLTGGRKIGRVFRDEDELPLSSSLSDSIVHALDDSEFLIVICTPDLPLSRWCEQEIRYFLNTHDRDHVITVLADGIPDDSFSPLLLHTYDEEGNITGDTEPLAANIAADTDRKRWKLFAKEKFRILACLIGCAFDELYKREQRYKRRRAAALGSVTAAVVLLFIGVLLNRNAVIRKNYEQALRNQSVYLAAESQRLLEEGDRLSAIAVAIEALPSEEGERPLVSKAEYALAESVNAYSTDWYRGRRSNYVINSALKHSNAVRSFILSENGDVVVSLSKDSLITAWDSEKSSALWSVPVSDDRSTGLIDILPDGTVVFYDYGTVYFADGQSGSVLYALEGSEGKDFGFITGAMISKDHGMLAVSDYRGIIRLFDTESKEEICCIESDAALNALAFSDDGSMLAAGSYRDGNSDRYESVRVYDTESGSVILDLDPFPPGDINHTDVIFTGDGRLCISHSPYYSDISGMVAGTQMMFFAEKEHHISLYDISNGRKVWEVSSCYYSTNDGHRTIYTEDLGGEPVFVSTYSNSVDIVDAGTGELLSHAEYPSAVVYASVYDDAVQCLTADGGFGALKSGDKQWSLVYSFVHGIESAVRDASDYWIVQDGSDSILHYGYSRPDPSGIVIEDDITDDAVRAGFSGDSFIYGSDSFVIGSYGWRDLLYFDRDAKELRYRSLSDEREGYGSDLKCFPIRLSDGVLTILKASSSGTSELWNVKLAADDRKVCFSPEENMEFLDAVGDVSAEEWYGIVMARNENFKYDYYLVSYDYEFNQKNRVLIKESSYESVSMFLDEDGSLYVRFSDTDEVYVIDTEKCTARECSGAWGGALAAAGYNEFGKRVSYDADADLTAVSTGDRIVLFDRNKTLIREIGDGSFEFISAAFAEKGRYIVALCRDNQIRRYDLKTGQMLSRCDVDYDCSYIGPEVVDWIVTDKGIMVMMLQDRCSFIISEDDWDISARIPDCTAYLPSEDLFVLIPAGLEDCEAVGFRRHTAGSLTDRGREILGDWELSESQKMKYGTDQ